MSRLSQQARKLSRRNIKDLNSKLSWRNSIKSPGANKVTWAFDLLICSGCVPRLIGRAILTDRLSELPDLLTINF